MIRGFKLEMSDAQHITDVYSEVAAISASDTQELATAMSKTASSAASVGMSFENTTAMISTMIEATRESATNINIKIWLFFIFMLLFIINKEEQIATGVIMG